MQVHYKRIQYYIFTSTTLEQYTLYKHIPFQFRENIIIIILCPILCVQAPAATIAIRRLQTVVNVYELRSWKPRNATT